VSAYALCKRLKVRLKKKKILAKCIKNAFCTFRKKYQTLPSEFIFFKRKNIELFQEVFTTILCFITRKACGGDVWLDVQVSVMSPVGFGCRLPYFHTTMASD
jgi:hypothetical protein